MFGQCAASLYAWIRLVVHLWWVGNRCESQKKKNFIMNHELNYVNQLFISYQIKDTIITTCCSDRSTITFAASQWEATLVEISKVWTGSFGRPRHDDLFLCWRRFEVVETLSIIEVHTPHVIVLGWKFYICHMRMDLQCSFIFFGWINMTRTMMYIKHFEHWG